MEQGTCFTHYICLKDMSTDWPFVSSELPQARYGGSPQDGRLHESREDWLLTIEDLVRLITSLAGHQRAPACSDPLFSPFHTDSRTKPTRHKVSRASVSALGQRHRREEPESGTAETAPN